MTRTLERNVTSTSDSAAPETPARAGHWRMPLLLQATAMLGMGILLYPFAADWFSRMAHGGQLSSYVEQVNRLSDPERSQELALANTYNEQMPQGVLRDPYSDRTEGSDDVDASAYHAYENLLHVSDNGVLGELRYGRLGIGLPIFHGTSDEVLSRGVGHLYGSSLPVGGPSTHSVMTSHSGLANAELFSPMLEARLGDYFQVSVLGETRHYRVDMIETVLPEDTSSLAILEGKDYVTLITCTPLGVNSHRLLVRGVRVVDPTEIDQAINTDRQVSAGIPWWALGFIGGSAAVAALLYAPHQRRTTPEAAISAAEQEKKA